VVLFTTQDTLPDLATLKALHKARYSDEKIFIDAHGPITPGEMDLWLFYPMPGLKKSEGGVVKNFLEMLEGANKEAEMDESVNQGAHLFAVGAPEPDDKNSCVGQCVTLVRAKSMWEVLDELIGMDAKKLRNYTQAALATLVVINSILI